MIKFIFAFSIVVVFLVGTHFAVKRARMVTPSQDVIDRVKLREQELQAQERTEKED